MNSTATDVVVFLKRYAHALSEGDIDTLGGAWHAPALVLGEGGAVAIDEPDALVRLLDTECTRLRARGVDDVVLQMADIAEHSPTLATVEVTWRLLDAEHRRIAEERVLCLLSRSDGATARWGIDLYVPDV